MELVAISHSHNLESIIMAEKAEAPSEALRKLEQQLACPVCLDRYTQPRILPCFHSFCHDCLGQFPVMVQEGKHVISCPMCRQNSQLPDNGVSGFQSAFNVNHLLEIHQVLQMVCGLSRCQKCNNEQANCYCQQCFMLLCQTCINKHNEWITDHQILRIEDVATIASRLLPLKKQTTIKCSSHEKELEVYCDTCDKLICLLCTATTAHHSHKYEPLTDAFPRHNKQIADCLDLVKQKLVAITAAVQAVKTHEECFLEQVGTVRKEIEATVQQLIQLLEQSEKRLIAELEQVTDAYVEKISARKEEADLLIAQLRSCEEFAEENLRIGSQQEIMVLKNQMAERMQDVCFQVAEGNLRPLEETSVTFAISASVLDACCNLGSVVRLGHVEVACNKTTFDLYSAAPLSSELVSCQLSPVADPTLVFKCVVHQVTPGRFEFRYSPPTAGLHQLRVQVGGTDILDTPLNVEVMPRRAGQTFTDMFVPEVFQLDTLSDGELQTFYLMVSQILLSLPLGNDRDDLELIPQFFNKTFLLLFYYVTPFQKHCLT